MSSIVDGLELRLLQATYSELDRRWRRASICDQFSRIYLITGGRGKVGHEGRCIILQPLGLYLLPAGITISFACDHSMQVHWVHLFSRLPGGVNLFSLWQPGVLELFPTDTDRLINEFQELAMLKDSSSAIDSCRIQEILFGLLRRFMVENEPLQPGRRDERIRLLRPILAAMGAEPERQWSLAELAEQLKMSKVSCNSLFREVTGVPPGKWLKRQRVEKARTLLLNTAQSIEAIAAQCGFYDAFHFSREFKIMTGMAPTHFRKLPQDRIVP